LAVLRDLKCWIKYDNSSLPELVKIKAVERCLLTILKITDILWKSFEISSNKGGVLKMILKSFNLIDWLCA
jgi:hypothetical protein